MAELNGPTSVAPYTELSLTPASTRESPVFFARGPPPYD